ncbi:DUF5302 domain-containing protein [Tsukamurella sp. 8F]|uniref:DUF5302 domain-containing protein n=1 Tax=unclassified Tsukamurella TaxID=2633480 RepID=UPI0023B9B2D0|nr:MULTISPECIES: DUF5302 domain-containing protein [unclassified Tsukamurella]MDF0530832.1 DUF5302 domain-containing protein [Tsukamurella sp. 8J]MDF0588223.1 DUF5302 domain-containing protein [Tsukamurella sp. 8F]
MPTDEQRAKFKEALERKNSQAKSGTSHLDGHGKAEQAHGSQSHQQQFRRKSG